MKIVQEENIPSVEHHLSKRFELDTVSCLFFVLGMFMSAYILHHFIL
jgi:hypothetical protein